MTEIEPSTLHILNTKGQTIDSGFLVSKTLAVTCTHVSMVARLNGKLATRIQAAQAGMEAPGRTKFIRYVLESG